MIKALAQDSTLPQPGHRILLLFDQEDSPSERDRANQIAQDLQNANPSVWSGLSWTLLSSAYPNLFKARHRGACIVLHISNVAGHGIGSKDFGGYILQLLQYSHANIIVQQIIPSSMSLNPADLISKARHKFTQIMQKNGYPWQSNKAWLYAYITAFQFRNSHIWFAKEIVEKAIRQNKKLVQQTFASLIYAWNWLVNNGGTCP